MEESTRSPRYAATFAVTSAGVALVNLDLFIVNVALPEIGRSTGAGLSSLSWVLNAYAIVFAALLVPAGRLADRTGRRRAFLAGIALFAGASAVCAAAGNVWLLVAARTAQAAGGALLMPASLGLLLAAAPTERRVQAVRAWSAIGGVSAALGPVLGGLLVAASWRWVFLVNLPVAAVTVTAGRRVLPDTRATETGARPDAVGATVFAAAVGLLALGLVKSADWGWSSPATVGCLAAAAVLLAAFLRRTASHPAPVLELSMFRLPAFATATAAGALFSVAFAAMLLCCTLWCQGVWHWSALRTGLAIAPGPLMVPLLAVGAGPLARRTGAGPLAAVGCLVFAAGAVQWHASVGLVPDYVGGLLPGMLLTGIGVGLTLPTLVGAAVSAVPAARFATGSAVVTMARQVGTVLGVALLVTVLDSPATPAQALAGFDRGCDLIVVSALLAAVGALVLARRTSPPALASPSSPAATAVRVLR